MIIAERCLLVRIEELTGTDTAQVTKLTSKYKKKDHYVINTLYTYDMYDTGEKNKQI